MKATGSATRSRGRGTRLALVTVLAGAVVTMGGTRLGLPARAAIGTTNVYFDQAEETDFWQAGAALYPGPATRQVVKPWDTNGQLCLFPDGSGRFVIAYNPTFGQTEHGVANPGNTQPNKQPAVGEAVYYSDGSYSPDGTTDSSGFTTTNNLHVPGPYLLTAASSQWKPASGVTGPGVTRNGLDGGSLGLGGDIPPDANGGAFNNNGTFTGCAFDTHGNFFAVDLGTSQGSYPPSSSGRLIEWFKDSGYRGTCIIYGPNAGGDLWPTSDGEGFTTHHADGTGGLEQPGLMAADGSGNIYVPVDDADPASMLPQGKVLEFSNLPSTESGCPTARPTTAEGWQTANGDQVNYHVVNPTVFIDGLASGLPFPGAIAWDPPCGCWAVDNIFFGLVAVEFFSTSGQALLSPAPIPANYATPSSALASNLVPGLQIPAGTVNPFGMAFDRQGDLFVVDIGVGVDVPGTIKSGGLQAGPMNNAGRLLEYKFDAPIPGLPTVIASGENYPVSVTTCDTGVYAHCPAPAAG